VTQKRVLLASHALAKIGCHDKVVQSLDLMKLQIIDLVRLFVLQSNDCMGLKLHGEEFGYPLVKFDAD